MYLYTVAPARRMNDDRADLCSAFNKDVHLCISHCCYPLMKYICEALAQIKQSQIKQGVYFVTGETRY